MRAAEEGICAAAIANSAAVANRLPSLPANAVPACNVLEAAP